MKSICKKFHRIEILAAILCVFSMSVANAQLSLSDYGALPPVAKPAGDQSAANQKLDFHTDLLTGRFNYQIPIEVPPGRQGSEPAIALQYNSSGGNGWCGVGWDLDMGYIQRETRYGVPLNGSSYNDSAGFVFSIAGQSGRLILASDGTYRPEINAAFLKFVYANGYWVVTDKEGRQYTFGDTSNSRLDRYYLSSVDEGTFKWALSKIVDPNGNGTTLTYQTLMPSGRTDGRQLYLSQIDYNANINSPAIAANCTVYFTLETTDRSDISSSCLSGGEVCTSRRLQYITVYCNGSRVRLYTLQYLTSSSTGHSLLNNVTEYGVDNSTAWPPLTFSYSIQGHSFQPPVVWPMQDNYSALATPGCQLVDINGDGLPDRVARMYGIPCIDQFNVQTNTGTGFGPTQYWSPVTNEGNEACSGQWNTLEGFWVYDGAGDKAQLTALIDINGDGLPDRVMRSYSMTPDLDGTYHFQVQTNTGTGFSSVLKWTGENSENIYPVLNSTDGTESYSLLVDMNGDGFPDRVIVNNAASQFDVQLNNKDGTFSPIKAWNNVISSGGYYPYAPRNRDNNGIYSELMDMNGDGLPDRVLQGGVQLNNGQSATFLQSFSALHGWGLRSTEYPQIQNVVSGCYIKELIDLNGDGLPDLVTNNGNGAYTVHFNTGSGFSSSAYTWTGVNVAGGDPGYLTSWWSQGTFVQFMDMNGDGLADRVIYNSPNATTNNNSILVQLNKGPFPDLMTGVNNGIGGWVAVTYTNATHWNNSDGARSRLSQPLYTVTSVQTGDSIRTSGTTTYSYTGGFYDTTWREFRGFAIVTATDPLGTVTQTYFHQGGGPNLSSHGEYQDSRFKAGMPYDVITYGSDGFQYKETLSQIAQVEVDPNGVYFPFVTNVFEADNETGYPRVTLKQYRYAVTANNLATSTGNLLQESELGEVTNVTYTFNFTDAPDSAAPVYTTYAYATLSNPNIIDKPSSVTISADAAGQTVLRQTTYLYFGATGNLQQKAELICPGTFAVTGYTYDNYGNLQTTTDPVGIITTINYDSASATFPWRKYTGTLGNNLISYSQFDPRSGDLFYATNEQGMVTANTYDGLLRLTQTSISTTPNGAPTLWRKQYQYSLGGIVSLSSYNSVLKRDNDPADPNGYHQSITFFDGLGRVIQVQDEAETSGQYRVSDVFYDQRGEVMVQTYPLFAATGLNFQVPTGKGTNVYTTFDPIGRVNAVYPFASVTYASGALANYPTPLTGDGGSPVGPTLLGYHDTNNPWAIIITNALGKVHKYILDSFGRTNQIVEVTSQGNFTTKLAYDRVGNLTNITDNANNQISFFYDLVGHQVALADPDMGFWQYGYDLDGRLKVQTDAKGQQIKFFYNDPAGRVTRREGWNTANQLVSTNTWQYDSNAGDTPYTVYPGQVYQITDDQGWQKFGYDVRNRTLKSVRFLGKNGNTYTNQSTLDDADRLSTTIYPNGGPTIMNVYDTGLHLSQVKQVGGSGITFYTARGFNELSQLTGVNFGNGAATTFNYYRVSKRLNQILTTATGSTTIQNFTNRYDAVGNVVGLQDNVAGHTGSASATISSAVYDDLNRLTSATWSGYGQKTYGYNSIGNVLTNGEYSTGTYSYGTARPHMVKSVAGINYTYDGNGNMVYRAGQLLSYDVNNRLAQVTGTNGVITTFGYDAGGARLWEQTGTNSLQLWMGNNYEEKNGQILYHVLANGQSVCTFDKTGTNVFEYYHPDYLTSTTLQTDQNGNQIQHYEYSAFGQTRYTGSTTAFPVSCRYTGQILDDATGLYYYNARYYDPQLGRFIQPDDTIPDFADPQSYNRYTYCVNNPLRFTDPSGKWGQEVANWWAGTVNTAFEYYTAGSQNTLLIGTLGTVNTLVGGVAAPLTLGSSAGSVSGNPNATGKQIAIAAVTETANLAAIIPAAAGAGKAVSTLVRAGEKEAVGEVAGAFVPKGEPCFIAGTLIATEFGFKPIEDIRPGDVVWSFDETTGDTSLKTVRQMFIRSADVTVELQIGIEAVTATPEHPFWVEGTGWTGAGSLKVGDIIRTLDGEGKPVAGVHYKSGTVKVYNFEVVDAHSYFVSKTGLLVHNACTAFGNTGEVGRGPNGGLRNASDQKRLADQLERRRLQRENLSRKENGQKPRGKSTDHDSANKGPSGERPQGPDTKNKRERNVGIDEEHSRVPKGTGGMPQQ